MADVVRRHEANLVAGDQAVKAFSIRDVLAGVADVRVLTQRDAELQSVTLQLAIHDRELPRPALDPVGTEDVAAARLELEQLASGVGAAVLVRPQTVELDG